MWHISRGKGSRCRNKGGKTVFDNLQALCYTCNAQKRDLDAVDFRPWKVLYENRDMNCVFCNMELSLIKSKNSFALSIDDKYPIVKGHSLIVPFFDLGSAEQKACFKLLEDTKRLVAGKDPTVSGFNIGVNDGIDAGQTILHCHIHLIPRRKGDVPDPRGGIRRIILVKATIVKVILYRYHAIVSMECKKLVRYY